MIHRLAGAPGPQRFDAAVVGRGTVGMAAALALARAGLSVAIVGPAARVSTPAHDDDWDSRVYALSPGSRGLLSQLRVWDGLPAQRVQPVYDMRVAGASDLSFSAYESGTEALAWIVENRALLSALDPALRFSGVASHEASVDAMQVDADAARLTLSDGSLLECRLVVGADGAQSRVREQARLPASIMPYPQAAVVANFRCGRPHLDTAYQWFGAHGVLAMLPLPADAQRRGGASMVWSAPLALAEELAALSPETLAARVAQATGGLLGELRTITPAQRYPLQLMTLRHVTAARVALVGDAAHMMHPLAGQGMNAGFGDVAELVRVLAAREPGRDPGDPLLMRRYARGRREAVVAMQTITDGLQKLFSPGVPGPVAMARDLGWSLLERSPWAKRRLIAQAMQ